MKRTCIKQLALWGTMILTLLLGNGFALQAGLLETQSNPVNWGSMYWGNPTNWDTLGIPHYPVDTASDGTLNRDVSFISIAHDANYFFVRYHCAQGPTFGGDYNLWIDTDLDPSTGVRNWSGTGSIGSERLVTGAALIQDINAWTIAWLNWDQNVWDNADVARDVIFSISRSAQMPGVNTFDFTFQFYNSGSGATGDWYPDSADATGGDFFRYTTGEVPMAAAPSSSDAYQRVVLADAPLAYYRLNETTPPAPDVATNSGSIGAAGNGIYTVGAQHPVAGALVGGSDAAARFFAVDTNSIDGGVPVRVFWPESPVIRELWDNVGIGVLNKDGDGSSSIGFDPGATWHVNLGNMMKVAQDFDITAPPGPPYNRGQQAGLWADVGDLGGLSDDWDTASWATRALAASSQINFGTNGDYWISVRVDNSGDTAMGVGFANGGDGSAQFVGVGAMWNNAVGPDAGWAGDALYVTDGTLGTDSPYAIRAYTGNTVNGPGLILAHLTTTDSGVDTLEAAVFVNGDNLPTDPGSIYFPVSYAFTNSMVATHLLAWLNGDTSSGAGKLDAIRVTTNYSDVVEGQLNTAGSFSVEVWLKPAQEGAGNAQSPLYNRDPNDASPNRAGWDFFQRNSATGWNFRMFNGVGHGTVFDLTGGPYTVGQWCHLVAVYDASVPSATLYLNGVQVAYGDVPNGTYLPNGFAPLSIGGYSDASQNPFIGDIDEVALYTNALTSTQVLAHYQNGTNSAPGAAYGSLVLNDGAVEYLRLDDPAENVAVNSGTLGGAADGVYNPNAANGGAGPVAPGDSGFESSNTAAFFNGANSCIELRNPAALNFTGQITLEAWVQPSVTPAAPGAYGNIIAHGYDEDYNEVALRVDSTGGTPQYSISTYRQWEGHGVSAAVPAEDLGTGNWVHLVGTYDGANWNLYRNGVLVASDVDAGTPPGSLMVLKGNWAIGARGRWAHMNVLNSGLDRQFQGKIDEPAIYDRALTPAEVQAHYYVGAFSNPALQISPSGTDVILTWPVGTLQEADEVTGPYTDVTGAVSGYSIPASAAKKFFRLRL